MKTAIVVNVGLARRIPPHDDVAPKTTQADRTFCHAGCLTDRVPQVDETELQLRLEFHARAQWKTRPPFATINCPVIKDASSDSRNDTMPAMSSGVPSRGIARFRMFHSRFA